MTYSPLSHLISYRKSDKRVNYVSSYSTFVAKVEFVGNLFQLLLGLTAEGACSEAMCSQVKQLWEANRLKHFA